MTHPSAAPAVRLRNITVRYGARTALHEVSLNVIPGEFVALAGPNGSGKTTLIRSVLGFLEPSEGSIELFGRPLSGLSVRDRARQVAWVPQEEAPRDNVPLEEYILYGRYPFHRALEGETTEDRRIARDLLRALDLEDRAADGILSLSGGERQRAVLGRALAQSAPLLLLDEPTSHLDIGHQLDLLSRVRELAHRDGVTVIAALHDLNLAAQFADRIVVLSRGRCHADGPPSKILTEALLAHVWGVIAERRIEPRTGRPYLIPRRLLAESSTAVGTDAFGPIHVVGGGGAASPYLRALVDEGFEVSAGILHLLDSDAETAEALGIPATVEVPFAPISPAVRERHRALLSQARAIVVTPFAVGPSNLANLEDLGARSAHVPIFLVTGPSIETRDFTQGVATRLVRELEAGGARSVGGIEELLRELRALAARAVPAGAAGPDRGAP
ncbi:MAG: ABC transporter ATP-binding protein [Thermoplasmata archaeon]|nr:ABC transporter ATP-binding protein [Thermoplasmata archaeon]